MLIDRLVDEAMSGQFLNGNFSMPCPPGLDIPPEVEIPFTSNSLKVCLYLSLTHTHSLTHSHTLLLIGST